MLRIFRNVVPKAVSCGRFYHENVISHYENPRNVGKLDSKLINVGSAIVGAPACGDVMKLQIQVNDKGIIEKAVFLTFGCGSAIASSSYVTEWLKGRHVDEAYTMVKNTDIAQYLNLPPVKLHCSMLAEDVVKAAIKDYKHKNDAPAATATTEATATAATAAVSQAAAA